MPIDFSQPAPPTILAFYPGMARAEQTIWDRFLTSNLNDFQGFLYNVRVGMVAQAPEGTEPQFQRMWADINQTRLDALGMRENELIVFEVKVSAGLSAIGQALGGQVLAQIDSDDPRPISAAIVSDGIRPDVVTVANVDCVVR